MQGVRQNRDAVGKQAADQLNDGKGDIEKEGNEQVLRRGIGSGAM